MKSYIVTIDLLITIVCLTALMLNTSSVLFTILSGAGAVYSILIYDDYKKMKWEKERESKKVPEEPIDNLDNPD